MKIKIKKKRDFPKIKGQKLTRTKIANYMGIFFDTKSSDPRPDHIKNAEKLRKRDKELGNEGAELIEQAQKLKERCDKEDALKDFGKEGVGVIIDNKTYYDVEELEADQKIQKKAPIKKEAGRDSLWVDEKTAKKIGLSESEVVDEAKFELEAGINLAELRKDIKQQKIQGWKKQIKKLEREMDFELEFHPERIKFVSV